MTIYQITWSVHIGEGILHNRTEKSCRRNHAKSDWPNGIISAAQVSLTVE